LSTIQTQKTPTAASEGEELPKEKKKKKSLEERQQRLKRLIEYREKEKLHAKESGEQLRRC